MKDQLWEEKWDDFSKKEIREAIEMDQQEELRDQKILDWIKANEEQVKELISSKGPHAEAFPRDDVFEFELNTKIEGHEIYWRWVYALSRDGDEDSDGEFTIDGKEPHSRASWDIDQYLADLCQEMV